MRKLYLILVILAAVTALVYLMRPREGRHSRSDDFVNVYVDLSLLQQYGDTAVASFSEQRDSILAVHGFTDSSLNALKEELNEYPLLLTVLWDEIEIKLRELKDEHSPLDLPQMSDTAVSRGGSLEQSGKHSPIK